MEDYIGKVCPYCKTVIQAEDEVTVCPSCGIPHHASCWEENRGCTTFGCSEQRYEEQHTNPTDVCACCGTPLGDGQNFCPNCGAPKNAGGKLTCSRCGAELMDGAAFCPMCGQRAGTEAPGPAREPVNTCNAKPEKKSRKKLALIAAICAAVVLIAGIFIVKTVSDKVAAQQAQEQLERDVAQYRENAKDFLKKVTNSGGKMEDIGNTIQTYWGKYVYGTHYYNGHSMYSVDDAVEAAQSDEYSKIIAVMDDDDAIEALYKTLMKVPDTSDQELLDIKEEVKDTYNAYRDMYDCIINVSGNYTSFKSEFGDTDSGLARAIRNLSDLL